MTLASQSAGSVNFYGTLAALNAAYPAAVWDGFDAVTSDVGPVWSIGGVWSVAAGLPSSYTPPFPGSVPTTVTKKLAQTVSVLDFGADPTGVADSTNAFNLAVANCSPATPFTGSTIAVGAAGDVFVGPGTWLITSQINTNGATITWTLADGAIITPSSSYALLNGRILRSGKQDTQFTNGIFYNATGFSTRNNVPIDSPPAVMGFLTPSQISAYPTCDSVACYADNTAVPPLAIIAASGTTYTTTTIAFTSALSATILGQLRVGMIVQTTNNPVSFYSGFVTAWDPAGLSITVSGWFQQGNAAAGQTPPNGNGAWVSPITKIFAYNGNVTLRNGTGYAAQAAGFEMGCLNNNAAQGSLGTLPTVWGYDCVNLGTFGCDTAYIARHNSVGFFAGFQLSGVNNAGVTVQGFFDQTVYGNAVTNAGIGFLSAGATASGTAITNVRHFQASNTTLGGGGSTIGTQVGFQCQALSGATNNYGFLSAMASGANNVAFYAQGTAVSIFGGVVNFQGVAAAVSSGLGFSGQQQTTVGATGAASVLPANPLGYIIAFVGATKVAIPYYNG